MLAWWKKMEILVVLIRPQGLRRSRYGRSGESLQALHFYLSCCEEPWSSKRVCRVLACWEFLYVNLCGRRRWRPGVLAVRKQSLWTVGCDGLLLNMIVPGRVFPWWWSQFTNILQFQILKLFLKLRFGHGKIICSSEVKQTNTISVK